MTDTDSEKLLLQPEALRRRLTFGIGVVAAVAGVGVALWQSGETVRDPKDYPGEDFWAMQWDTPSGGVLKMADLRSRPLLINFWATWCPPCIEELPLINDFYSKNQSKGWQVVGLAVDRPASVQSFLSRMPLNFPVGLAGMAGGQTGKALGNISESLPFSVVIGAGGKILQRKLGKLSADELASWAALK